LRLGVLRIARKQLAGDIDALLGGRQRVLEVAGVEIGVRKVQKHSGLAAKQAGIVGRRRQKLINGLPAGVENLAYGLDPQACHIAQTLGNVEDKPVHRRLRGDEIALRDLTLPIGEAREPQRDDEARGEA
jgi:hypothetical protein